MEIQDFIEEQIKMIKNDFDKTQIKDNVYRYVFKKGIPNITIDSLIFQCMDLYSEIITRSCE